MSSDRGHDARMEIQYIRSTTTFPVPGTEMICLWAYIGSVQSAWMIIFLRRRPLQALLSQLSFDNTQSCVFRLWRLCRWAEPDSIPWCAAWCVAHVCSCQVDETTIFWTARWHAGYRIVGMILDLPCHERFNRYAYCTSILHMRGSADSLPLLWVFAGLRPPFCGEVPPFCGENMPFCSPFCGTSAPLLWGKCTCY